MNAPAVNASAAPTEVRLGAKFTVFIEATFGAGVEVNLQEPVELGGAFEVRRKLSQDTQTADGRTRLDFNNPRPDEVEVLITARKGAP